MAILFQDNFDSHADSCHTGGDVPSGWYAWNGGTASATRDSVTHYSGEISATGYGGSGKSLKLWRHSDFTATGEFTGLDLDLGSSYQTIYFRYYQKLPTALDLTFNGANGNYLKFWRFQTTAATDLYLDASAPDSVNMRAGGDLHVQDDETFNQAVISAGDLDTTIWDGDWHCLEFHIGLGSTTLRFWLDGILYYSNTSFNWGDLAGESVTSLGHFGFGNYSNNYSWQSSWQAAEWDNLVIADEYVGPLTSTSKILGISKSGLSKIMGISTANLKRFMGYDI